MEDDKSEQMVVWHAKPTELQLSTIATIVVDGRGCSVQTITAGRKRYPSGRYASVKSGTGQPWHRHAQRALVQLLEVDPAVVDYRMHPHVLMLSDDPREQSFIPHCVADRADGTTEIIEVERKMASPGRRKEELERAERIYLRLGWVVTRISAEKLEARTASSRALGAIQQARHTRVSLRHVQIAKEAQAAAEILTLGALAQQLGGSRIGTAVACALMVRRHLQIQLIYPIGPAATVSPPPPMIRTDNSPTFKVWKNAKNQH